VCTENLNTGVVVVKSAKMARELINADADVGHRGWNETTAPLNIRKRWLGPEHRCLESFTFQRNRRKSLKALLSARSDRIFSSHGVRAEQALT
jgi:hypothetical protein